MDWTLEVVVLPVSDISRSIVFYRDQVGFKLDHHTQNEHMNAAQLLATQGGGSSPKASKLARPKMRAS